jgi:cytochrome b561
MSTSQPLRYSPVQIGLHWIIAALIVFQLIFGESMADLAEALKDGGTPDATTSFMANAHIWVGIAILALMAIRIAARFLHGVPAPLPASKAQDLAAKAVHGLLYLLMILAPVTGLVAWYGGIEAAGAVHHLMKPVWIVLIALHIAGALYHQFAMKDGTMQRMKFGRA